jgi:hypothetical protein
VLVLQLHLEHRIGERLEHRRFDFDCVFLGQTVFLVFSLTASASDGSDAEDPGAVIGDRHRILEMR